MKPTYIIIAVVVIGAAVWFLQQGSDSAKNADTYPAPAAERSNDTVTPTETVSDTSGESASIGAPTQDSTVSEQVVESNPEEVSVEVESETVVTTPAPVAETISQVIDITGKNFAFSENTIRVKEGATVTINFTSTGGFHDWVVDEFSAATKQVSAGGSASVTFVANKKGSFEYYCSVGSHRAQGMVGTLIVE